MSVMTMKSDMLASSMKSVLWAASGMTHVPDSYLKAGDAAYYVGPDGFLWGCVEQSDSGAYDWSMGFNVDMALYAQFEVFVPDSVVWYLTAVVSTLKVGIARGVVVTDGSHLVVPIELDNGR